MTVHITKVVHATILISFGQKTYSSVTPVELLIFTFSTIVIKSINIVLNALKVCENKRIYFAYFDLHLQQKVSKETVVSGYGPEFIQLSYSESSSMSISLTFQLRRRCM